MSTIYKPGVSILWLLLAAGDLPGAAVYYVATNGSDSAAGTQAAPFATLEKARDALRAIAPVAGGATVYLRGGTYYRTNTLVLTSADSGLAAGSPVVWRNYPGETATLIGGLPLTNWQILTGNVMVVNIRTQGFSGTINKLVCDGVLQRKARWPNWTDAQPYDTAFKLAVGAGSSTVFNYAAGDLPRAVNWANPGEGEVCIFSGGQFNNTLNGIASINTGTRTINLGNPAQYTIVTGNKFYVRGLREELDAPGEWYLSPGLMLYFYPSNSIGGSLVTAPKADNLFALAAGCSNLTIYGLNLSCSSLAAVTMAGTTNCVVTGCTINNVGDYNTDGVSIAGGYQNGASSNVISYVGRSGVSLTGGVQRTLTPSTNYATYNFIHHMGVECKEGSGVDLGGYGGSGGVGMYVAHNQIWAGPRSGINFLKVNNCLMEYNHIYNVMQETDDGGAIYSQNDMDWISARGCTVRYNYIHDCSGYGWYFDGLTYAGPYMCHGIFLDGMTCGVDIYRNIVARVPHAGIFFNGGRDNWVRNNILIDCALTTVNNESQFLLSSHNPGNPDWDNNLSKMTAGYNSVDPGAWAGVRGYPNPSPATVNTYSYTSGSNRFETNIFCFVNSPSPIYAKTYGYSGNLNNVKSNYFNRNVIWGGTSRAGYGSTVYDLFDSLYEFSAAQSQLGVELNSVQNVDPQFYGAATNNYYVYNPAALANGFQQIDMSVIGPTNLFGAGIIVTNAPSVTSYLTGQALSSLYNDHSGFLGMKISVGSSPLTVTALGRIFVSGNSGTHLLKLVDAASGLDVPGGSVSLAMSGGIAGQIKYAQLSSPVVLAAGAQYYVVSQETYGGDFWYDYATTVSTTSVAAEQSYVYSSGDAWVSELSGAAGHTFGPVDFQYSTGVIQTNAPSVTSYVTGQALSSLYNNHSGFVGMQIGVGSSPLTVTALGRIFVSGNTGTHLLKLVDAASGLDVPGGSVSLAMSGGIAGQIKYAQLSSPVVLAAGAQYYVVSQETYGGDFWYDYLTTVSTTSVAADQSYVYSSGGVWVSEPSGAPGHTFGPVSLMYLVPGGSGP